jgi:hypothetical protein
VVVFAPSSEIGAKLVPKPAAAKIGALPSRPNSRLLRRGSFGSISPA